MVISVFIAFREPLFFRSARVVAACTERRPPPPSPLACVRAPRRHPRRASERGSRTPRVVGNFTVGSQKNLYWLDVASRQHHPRVRLGPFAMIYHPCRRAPELRHRTIESMNPEELDEYAETPPKKTSRRIGKRQSQFALPMKRIVRHRGRLNSALCLRESRIRVNSSMSATKPQVIDASS